MAYMLFGNPVCQRCQQRHPMGFDCVAAEQEADRSMVRAIERMSHPHADALGRLRQAIIGNTQGDLFWLGEILLAELEKETGFKGN